MPPNKNEIEVIEISSSSEGEENDDVVFLSPPNINSITAKRKSGCEVEPKNISSNDGITKRRKRGVKLEHSDNDDECLILEFDPFESRNSSPKMPTCSNQAGDVDVEGEGEDEDEVSIVAERGQVACRDYPHSRHLCVKFPFNNTSHQNYCKQCYCYVCDSIAPCQFWHGFPLGLGHCHATKEDPYWTYLRKVREQSPEHLKQLHTRKYT